MLVRRREATHWDSQAFFSDLKCKKSVLTRRAAIFGEGVVINQIRSVSVNKSTPGHER